MQNVYVHYDGKVVFAQGEIVWLPDKPIRKMFLGNTEDGVSIYAWLGTSAFLTKAEADQALLVKMEEVGI